MAQHAHLLHVNCAISSIFALPCTHLRNFKIGIVCALCGKKQVGFNRELRAPRRLGFATPTVIIQNSKKMKLPYFCNVDGEFYELARSM